MRRHDETRRNAEGDPGDVRFYPVTTSYSLAAEHALTADTFGSGEIKPDEFYDATLSLHRSGLAGSAMAVSAMIEQVWYRWLQPEYKAYPAIIAALAATKIEIEAEHLRMPFPAFAIRLPEGFLQEEGGPVLRTIMACMLKVLGPGASVPVASIDSPPAPGARLIPFGLGAGGKRHDHVFAVQVKYIDRDGDDAFSNFSVGLDRGTTIEESLRRLQRGPHPAGSYEMSQNMMREILSLAIGVSFFATGRHKVARPLVQKDKKPRHERRRFEKEHGGQEQPTFTVGRDLVLPRAEGAPEADRGTGPGEGEGRSLRFGHYRVGHLRYQAHGPGHSERKLIFVEPTVVRPDLPLQAKKTSSSITDRPSRDVTGGQP